MKNCSNCIHRRASLPSGCRINDRAELIARGHTLPDDGPPDPATFVCDDWEPP
jgi:hypothetical protein